MGFDTGKATILRYLSYLQESYFLKTLELHTPSIKNAARHPKPYFIDNASSLITRLNSPITLADSWKTSFPTTYQTATTGRIGKEIDFVIREKEVNKSLIQVSYATTLTEIKAREIDNLIIGSKILNCVSLVLITWNVKDVLKKALKLSSSSRCTNSCAARLCCNIVIL